MKQSLIARATKLNFVYAHLQLNAMSILKHVTRALGQKTKLKIQMMLNMQEMTPISRIYRYRDLDSLQYLMLKSPVLDFKKLQTLG